MTDAGSRGPIFVLGAQGSGTTVMRLILDSHDDIAMAQETGFARVLMANEWPPFAADITAQWYRKLGLTLDEFERELAGFYGHLFSRFAAERGATRWGDKTPLHVWHMELLARVFPDAVFVGMVRHPGAGAHSRTHRMGHSWSGSLAHWRQRNKELFRQGARLGERFVLCRYEDLVADPEPVLRELLDWLGEPWSDQVLDFHEVHRARGTPQQVEGWTHSDEPLDRRRIDAWIESMTPQRWARLRRGKVRVLCEVTGYLPDSAVPQPWPQGTALLHGDALAARIAAEHRIDWQKAPRAPLGNRPMTLQDLTEMKRAAAGSARPVSAVQRVERRTKRIGSAVLRRLPAGVRRPVRSSWWKVRSWLAGRSG